MSREQDHAAESVLVRQSFAGISQLCNAARAKAAGKIQQHPRNTQEQEINIGETRSFEKIEAPNLVSVPGGGQKNAERKQGALGQGHHIFVRGRPHVYPTEEAKGRLLNFTGTALKQVPKPSNLHPQP